MIDAFRRKLVLAGASAPVVLGAGQFAFAAQTAPDVEPVAVATGLRHPWSVAFLPSGDFLVSEKDGGLVRVKPDGAVVRIGAMPADLDNVRQDPRDNSGLFDVALHPDFAINGKVYMAYASKGDGGATTRLISGRLADDRLEDQETIFDALPRSADRFHYGGAVLITGGFLYLSVGERHFNERDNPALPSAQDPHDRRGKIYRFTLDGALAPPASSPHDWFACGVRATQGMTAHPETGEIWFTDHGSVGGDEINVLRPGANYGWPVRTSGAYRNADYTPEKVLAGAAYADPAHDWRDQTVAPTGLCFYDGSEFPEWRGNLLVAGLSRGNLVRAEIAGERVVRSEFLMRAGPVRLRNVKVSPAGLIYAVTDEPNGRLLRLARSDP